MTPPCAAPDVPPDLFFPSTVGNSAGNRLAEHAAKAICATCPIRDACLAEALRDRLHGIWGGTTDAERARMIRPECAICRGPRQPRHRYCEPCRPEAARRKDAAYRARKRVA